MNNATKIECPKCNAHFTMPTDRIPAKGAKARCSRCKSVFRVPYGGGRGVLKSNAGIASNPAQSLGNRDKSTLQASGRALDPELNAELAFDGAGDPFAKTLGAPFGSLNRLKALVPPPSKEIQSKGAAAVPHKDLFSVEDPFRKTNLGDAPGLGGSSLSDALDAYLAENTKEAAQPDAVVDGFAEGADDFFGESVPTALPQMNTASVEAAESFFGPGLEAQPSPEPDPPSSLQTPSEEDHGFLMGSLDSIDNAVPSMDDDHGFGGALIRAGSPEPSSMNAAEMDGNISLLGDMNRANQFAMDFDDAGDDEQFAGAYFDPTTNQVGSDAPAPKGPSALDYDGPLELASETPSAQSYRPTPPPSRPAASTHHTSQPLGAVPHTTGPVKVIPAAPSVSQLTVSHSTSTTQSIANIALIVLLVSLFFFGFVAWSHDGLLDFKHLGDQVKASFGQGAYTGRVAGSVGDVSDGTTPKKATISFPIENLQRLPFQNSKGDPLFILEGVVTNNTENDVKSLNVSAKLLEGTKPIAETLAPVARPISEEELFDALTQERLKDLYTTLRKEARGMILKPGQSAKFSAVFIGISPEKAKTLTHEVRAVVATPSATPDKAPKPAKEEAPTPAKSPSKKAPTKRRG